MKRCLITIAAVLASITLTVPAAHAQTTTVVASYSAGWNMVGGPPGTAYPTATIFQAFNPSTNTYFDVNPKVASLCQGYWAYFTDPTVVALDPTATGPTQTCQLQPGWNIIGNPFAGNAILPPNVTAYYYNPSLLTYQIVSVIPPGGAVWIESTTLQTITLQYQATVTPIPTTLVISDLTNTGPFTLHVGDSIKLQLPSATPHTVTTTPDLLQLESSGVQGPLSCITDPSCALTLVNQFWIYKAVAPGLAQITVTPQCTPTVVLCATIPTTILVNILP